MDQPIPWMGDVARASHGLKAALLPVVMLAILMCNGCQAAVPAQLEDATTSHEAAAHVAPTARPSLSPTLAPFEEPADLRPPPSPRPSPTPPPTPAFVKLGCEPQGRYARCTDEVLGIAFEYPAAWGEIETFLGGGTTGRSYYYFHGGRSQGGTEPLVAGGRSRDYTAGHGGSATGFRGLEDTTSQDFCSKYEAFYPVCEEIKPGVLWTVSFPNDITFCNEWGQDRLATATFQPVVRILVDLPENPTINGFVFQAPFLSRGLSRELDAELLPILGLGSALQAQGCPTPSWPRAAQWPCIPSVAIKCDDASRQAFDSQVQAFVEGFKSGALDVDTLQNLEDLMHLATSISFIQQPGG